MSKKAKIPTPKQVDAVYEAMKTAMQTPTPPDVQPGFRANYDAEGEKWFVYGTLERKPKGV